MQRRIGVMFAIGMLSQAGCKRTAAPAPGDSVSTGATPSATRPAPLDPATLGDVSGVVKFAGKAPEPVRIDTTMDPACGLAGADTYSEQYAVRDGKLANVYLYVKSGPAAAMAEGASWTAPVVLDQKGCRYTPHVVAAMVGQRVEFHNDDPTMHNIHTMPAVTGNEVVDISQGPKGAPQTKIFKKPEAMMPIRCNNHPWMNAFLNISQTPWFAVTGADGTFALKGMPAGDYTLGAVQEKIGEQIINVTVKPKSEAKIALTFAIK